MVAEAFSCILNFKKNSGGGPHNPQLEGAHSSRTLPPLAPSTLELMPLEWANFPI